MGGGPGSLFLAAPQAGIRYTPVRVGESALVDYAAHYRHQDFMQPALARAAVGALVLDEQVLPRDEQERLAFTNEWVRPNDVGGCVHAVLHRAPGLQVELGLSHRRRVDGFAPEALRVLRLLLPHIRRAVESGVRLATVQAERDAAGAALDSLADAVLLVDAAGRLLRANRAADRLLARADGLSIGRGGELRAATPAQTGALGRLVARAASPDESRTGGTLSLERPSLRSPLRLLAVPLPAGSAWPELPLEPGALLIVVDPDEPRALPAERLQALFGLTPAEAALAVALASGEGLPTVADRLGIARTTARTHADRVLAKTGTGRQAELARLLERLAALA